MSFYLFPGQGSQRPGMGRDFYDNAPAARQIFDQAAEILGGDFLVTLFDGDEATINHTSFAQPALLTVEVAIANHLQASGLPPSGCAGHSLGEIPALVVAGALTLEDALPLVRERARLMTEDIPAGGMAAVMGIDAEAIEAALPAGVQIANYNGPGQTIISGSNEAMLAADEALKAAGAKRVIALKVSGPFHSELMKPAAERFAAYLSSVPLKDPTSVFFSSVTATPVHDAAEIRGLLAQQLYSPVRWTQLMSSLSAERCLEIGPAGVLKGLAKRIDGAPEVFSVGSFDEAQALLQPS